MAVLVGYERCFVLGVFTESGWWYVRDICWWHVGLVMVFGADVWWGLFGGGLFGGDIWWEYLVGLFSAGCLMWMFGGDYFVGIV